ncbi:MAG: hypothetical protein AAGH76_15460 [Pseudomonadota bacterium]
MTIPARPWHVVNGVQPPLTLVVPNQRADHDTDRLCGSLTELLAVLGVPATVSIDPNTRHVQSPIVLLNPDSTGTPAGKLTIVRALRGVSRAPCPTLDAVIVSGDDASDSAADTRFATRIARTFGRNLIHVSESGSDSTAGEEAQSVAEVLTTLVGGPPEPLVLVAGPTIAGVLRDVAISLAGAERRAVTLTAGRTVWCELGWAPGRGSARKAVLVLIPAVIAMLAYRGRRRSAARLEAAWLRALEEGFRPVARLAGRSTKLIDPVAFVEEVTQRIGQSAQQLPSSFGTKRPPARPERFGVVR